MTITFQEFMKKSKKENFRGLPVIGGRDKRPGLKKSISLSWCGTNNDMWKSSEFGEHEVGPVRLEITGRSEANALGIRLKYCIEDIEN